MTEFLELIAYAGFFAVGTFFGFKRNRLFYEKKKEAKRNPILEEEELDVDLNVNEDDYNALAEIFSEDLRCALTLDTMREPVIDKYSFSYERAAIADWVKKNQTCPINRKGLTYQDLRPNKALKSAIKYELLKQKHKRLFNNL